jgi:DNA ligase-1
MKNSQRLALVCCYFFLTSQALPQIQKANIYHEEIDVSQYLVSEKFDGIRARWNGKNLISKNGNLINAPDWFVQDFPSHELDGELWISHGKFEEISSIVLDKKPNEEGWKRVKFLIFDLPKSLETFENRIKILEKIIKSSSSEYLELITQFEITDHESLIRKLDETLKNKGEGLMLHKKDSFYKAVRNDDLLKLKKFLDEEAIVLKYLEGEGKYKGKMGALLVENADKIRFKIGSGFSDFERENPPKIGSQITYKFYGKTKNNVPRFPVFLRIRKEE